jgi:esterase/lipase
VFQKLKKDFQKECCQKKIKNKEVYFIGLSIGNMPAFYFANRIKSKKLMAVCPTDRLGDGIFSALAAKQRGIKSRAIRRGYTPVRYDKIIQEFNPIKNLKNLPKNVEVYLGRFDKYVPYGGGKRLVKYLKKYNKKVVVKEFNFFGHFLTMMMFGLKNKN